MFKTFDLAIVSAVLNTSFKTLIVGKIEGKNNEKIKHK